MSKARTAFDAAPRASAAWEDLEATASPPQSEPKEVAASGGEPHPYVTHRAVESLTVYEISVAGTTYFGNANFLENNPTFSPSENFQLPGFLFVTNTLDPFDANGNGVNPFDVGITILGGSGTSSVAVASTAGALDWASNAGVHGAISDVLGRGYSPTSFGSLIDYCFTEPIPGGASFVMDTSTGISSGVQALDAWNQYLVRSGLLAGIHRVLAGFLQVQFDDAGGVQGQFDFQGGPVVATGFAGAGTSAIAGTFQGVQLQLP